MTTQGASTYYKTWASYTSDSFSGGSTRYASTPGVYAHLIFNGGAVAFVTTRATTRGVVKIYLDGVLK